MNNSFPADGRLVRGSNDATTDYPPPPSSGSTPSNRVSSPRCNLAWPGSGSSGSQSLACILRQRLFVASLIPAAGFAIYFVRHLIWPASILWFDDQWFTVVLGIFATILILISTLLGSALQLSTKQLRVVEVVLFGLLAGYFAFVQSHLMHHSTIAQWASSGHQDEVIRLVNISNILRWFALIVIYGTFVPNTWKRCATMVGILAGIPILISVVVCSNCPILGPHVFQALLDLIIFLGIASAIAIFGSWKISELQQEAMQARRLGQYQLKEKIGSGGMGEVYLGEHMMLRRACAIKLIRPDHNGDMVSMSRFEREVKAMAKLSHWNTVEVFDYGMAEDGTFYYVMEYLPGMSLQEMVERYGPLPPARAVHFLRQVCDALQEAHSIHLIHRDIKPSNVLATQRGGVYDVAKLLDFGLVHSVGGLQTDMRLTVQGTVLGSPPFMSPEQAMGKDNLDGRTDIYSVGGLAYYLLTGHPPFERETAMQVLMAHVYDDVVPPAELRPDIPEDLEEIILRCLRKDPAERFQDVESLQEALEQCDSDGDWTRRDAADWWQSHTERKQPVAV